MSGGTLVWLTDNELERLHGWYAVLEGQGCARDEDYDLDQKLEAIREEVACRVPRSSR
jgi:hypothetical protein